MVNCVVCQSPVEDDARFCPGCGAEQPKVQTADGDDPFLGVTIANNFKIEKLLGVGGMGKVYKARQLSLDKDVVIKVLHDHLSDDPQLVQRFQREAKAASRLSHPNSIQVIDFGKDVSGVLYMAIEFLNGTDLFSVLQKEGPLPAERIARIMIQVCSALGEAHEMNVIHRDLKPENIMVEDRRGRKDVVKVLDFGIAKIVDPDEKAGQALTQAGMVCGTPEYMSPEQARGQSLDNRSDLYSLGVLAYQLATGELPFTADSPIGIVTKHILEKPDPPRAKYPQLHISEGLEHIILKSMEKDADVRFQLAVEMQEAFEALLRTPSGVVPGFEEASQMAILSGGSHASQPTDHAGGPPAAATQVEVAGAAAPPLAAGTGTQVQMSATGSAPVVSAKVMGIDGPHPTVPTPTGLTPATFDDDELLAVGGGGGKKVAIAAVITVMFVVGAGVTFKDAIFGADGAGKTAASGDGDESAANANATGTGTDTQAGGQGGGAGSSPGVAKDPGAKDPGAQDPGAQDPGAKDPGAKDPGAKDPGAKDPGGVDAKNDTGQKVHQPHKRSSKGTKGEQDKGSKRGQRGNTKSAGGDDRDRVATADTRRDRRDRRNPGTRKDDAHDDHGSKKKRDVEKDDKAGKVVSRRPDGARAKSADDARAKKGRASKAPRRGDRQKAKRFVKAANKALLGGDMDDAYKLAKKAISADPSYADSRKIIAGYHRIHGNNQKACRAAKDYLSLSELSGPQARSFLGLHCK